MSRLFIHVLVMGSMINSCKSFHEESGYDPKLLGGQQVKYNEDPAFNGAVWPLTTNGRGINCTGTAVGHNTLITSAHCLVNGTTGGLTVVRRTKPESISYIIPPELLALMQEIEVTSPKDLFTTEAIELEREVNGERRLFFGEYEYLGPQGEKAAHLDIAVVLFPDNTFSENDLSNPDSPIINQASITNNKAMEGQKVTLYGHGRHLLNVESDGEQYMGSNTINEIRNGMLSADSLYEDINARKGEDTAIAPGDSGGPLLNEAGEIIGIAHSNYLRGKDKDHSDQNVALSTFKVSSSLKDLVLISNWVDVTSESSQELLQEALTQGANISGYSVGD